MAEATAYLISQLFSQLVGRSVTASLGKDAETKIKQMYGVYKVLPHNGTIVVKIDLPLLGSLAGSMVGFPFDTVTERLAQSPLDETLRDAMHEILNISSTLVEVEKRAVFQTMASDPVYCEGDAAALIQKPDHKSCFDIDIPEYTKGKLNILAQL